MPHAERDLITELESFIAWMDSDPPMSRDHYAISCMLYMVAEIYVNTFSDVDKSVEK